MRFSSLSSCRLVCCPAALLLVFSMTCGSRRAFAQCNPFNNVPKTVQVDQTGQERLKIVVNTDTRDNRGAAMMLDFYNAEGRLLGSDGAAPYGCGQISTFGPICSVAQPSQNIAYIIIRNNLSADSHPLQVNGVSFKRVKDRDPMNLGGATPATAANLSSRGTIYKENLQSIDPRLRDSATEAASKFSTG